MPNQGHSAHAIFDGLMTFLASNDIDIKKCRGQSYDNAAVMSGQHNGVQRKVKELSELAMWIPCAGHSLNLVGKSAAESCAAAIKFFDFLEELYAFFSASSHRFQKLCNALTTSNPDARVLVPQRISTTRWSCRADATKALVMGYMAITETLSYISDDDQEIPEVRSKASGLRKRMQSVETGIYSVFWNDILQRTDATNKMLQSPEIDINTAVASLRSLQTFVKSKRDCFQDYVQRGVDISGVTDFVAARERRANVRLAPLDYGRGPAVNLNPAEKFRVESYLPIIDRFSLAIEQRLSAYDNVCSIFGFLSNLHDLSVAEIQAAASKLVQVYSEDVDPSLSDELVQFQAFVSLYTDDKTGKPRNCSTEQYFYSVIKEKGVQELFPNVEVILRIYLVLMVTNCSSERSFSKMKLVKNRLRTSMCSDRLKELVLLSSEYDVLQNIDFMDTINDFARRKARRVHVL